MHIFDVRPETHNSVANSFKASLSNNGFKDAQDKYAKIFTTLNFYYAVYKNEYGTPAKRKKAGEVIFINFVLSLEKSVQTLWEAVEQNDNLVYILDVEQYTECFRRLSGFLNLVANFLGPLARPIEQEKDAQAAVERAEFVIQRCIKHLNCYADFYVQKYLEYLSKKDSLLSIKRFAENLFKDSRGQLSDNEHIVLDPTLLDFEQVFVDKNNILIPFRASVSPGEIKKADPRLEKVKFNPEEIKLDLIGSPETVYAPFDSVHYEVIPGECPLPDLPKQSFLNFYTDNLWDSNS